MLYQLFPMYSLHCDQWSPNTHIPSLNWSISSPIIPNLVFYSELKHTKPRPTFYPYNEYFRARFCFGKWYYNSDTCGNSSFYGYCYDGFILQSGRCAMRINSIDWSVFLIVCSWLVQTHKWRLVLMNFWRHQSENDRKT